MESYLNHAAQSQYMQPQYGAPVEAQMPDLPRIEAELSQIAVGIEETIAGFNKIATEAFGPLPPSPVGEGMKGSGSAIDRIGEQVRRLAYLRDELAMVRERFDRLV